MLECRTLLSATPTLTVTDAGGTFTGRPFVATASATVNNNPIPIGQSLNFSTYLGSTGTSRTIDVATDNFGNTFVTGWTTGSNFPTTTGAYETTGAADGSRSAFVVKFDPNGNLLWSTLIDGASAFAVAVDGSDNVYVAGHASAADFQTTTGAYQTTANASDNAFIAKLNPSGSQMLWATFLGGSGSGAVDGIALDSADNVYVAGDTTATDFPLQNPIQTSNAGGSDAFISELNSSGSNLVFSTYLGGSGDELPSAIALDPAGNIFISGTTDSSDLQTTANAFQSTYGGGDSDEFVAKLDSGGADFAYLTYLGGSGDVISSDVGMAVDAEGDAYVTGTTDADTIPMVNPYQSTFPGQSAFIAELNPSGTALVNSTYFGTGTNGSSLAMDSSGNVYISGQVSPGGIVTVDPASSSGDLYVAELNLSTATLVYSTYLGAADDSSIIDPVGVTSNGNIILSGDTVSDSFPTLNPYQSSRTGSRDAFVAGLQPELTISYFAGTTATGPPLSGPPSAVGTYTVVATFISTDPNYTDGQSDPVTFTISPGGPITPTVTAFETSGNYNGSPFAATATALGADDEPVSGTFAFTYYVGASATGTGTSTAPVDAGIYTVVASFTSSDPDYSDSQSPPVTFTISSATTATTVGASVATPVFGQSETLTATITSAGGTPTTGTISFFDGATLLGTVGINDGVATLPMTSLSVGLHVVTAAYSGDGLDFSGSSSIITSSSIIQTVAGTGVAGYNGDGIAAISAELNNPYGVAVDSQGDLFIADTQNNLVREVNATTHQITTVAGTGTAGYNGDGIAATSAELDTPIAVALDSAGDLFIADDGNSRVREVSAATGLISTVAGTGGFGFNGDGIAATSATLNFPVAVAVDSAGNLYIADFENQRVREVSAATGLISTVAGTGTAGYNGDGIAATAAELNFPTGIAVDAAGDLFISDSHSNLIREVNVATGLISTVAGTGTGGYNGDGILAVSAELNAPDGLAVDSAGNLFIVDNTNQRVREVAASTGLISTVAGTGFAGYNGDGIAVDSANLNYPVGLALDSAGDLFIGDLENNRIREIASGATTFTVTPAMPTVTVSDAGGVFNGNPFAATATVAGVVSGVDNTPGGTLESVPLTLTYYAGTTATGTPLPGAPSAVGTYTVVASFPGSQDYSTTNASANFSISRALPVISVSDAGGVFNGDPFPATATIRGIVSGVDDTPGSSLEGVSLTLTYYAGTSPTGTPLTGAPDNAGSYTVEASFGGSADYLSLGRFYSFVIFQAAPVFTVSDAGGTFNGSPFPGTGTIAGVVSGVDDTPGGSLEGVDLMLLYYAGDTLTGTPLSGAPSTAGSYTVEAYFPGSQDYSAGGRGYSFVISQATPVLTVNAPGGTYNGSPYSATATVAGIVTGVDDIPGSNLEGVELTITYYTGNDITGTPLSGPPTDAGTYTAFASFPGSTDYRPESDADVFSIAAATPTITVTDAGGSATGQPYPASATATGIDGASVSGTFAFTYYVGSTVTGQGSSTPPTDPGTYTVTAEFTSGDADYVNAPGGPVTFTINQSGPAVSAPSSASLYQKGSLTFSTANGNAISVSDNTASGTSDSITLSVTDGVHRFTTTKGLKFTAGSNNSASMTVNGTLANLNTALQSLKYTPSSGYFGSDTLSIDVIDAGNNLTDSTSVNLTIFGPPTLTGPSTANVNENAVLVFSTTNGNAITLADAAATANSDSLSLTVSHGTLSLGSAAGFTFTTGSNNSASMTITGTLSNLQAALDGLAFTPKTGYSGAASLTLKAKDAASGLNATATVGMTVVVPASQPTVTVGTPIPTSVRGEPVPLVITVSDTDPDANSANFNLSITFGDGKSANVSSTNALIVNHVYTKIGTYTVSVTATDEYGHVSAAATTTIQVVVDAVAMNPFDPSQTALVIGGTTSKDTIAVTALGNQIAVTVNKANEGTFTTNGPIIVFGQGGADVFSVGAGVTNSSYLLESANADNVETDLDNDAVQWAGLTSAVEILNK